MYRAKHRVINKKKKEFNCPNNYLENFYRINFFIYLLRTFCPHLGSFFVLFLLSLRFGQISLLAFVRWFTATSDRNAESCNRIPSYYCLPLLCLSHQVFDQINLWPAWVGFGTAIFWQCSPGTVDTQRDRLFSSVLAWADTFARSAMSSA